MNYLEQTHVSTNLKLRIYPLLLLYLSSLSQGIAGRDAAPLTSPPHHYYHIESAAHIILLGRLEEKQHDLPVAHRRVLALPASLTAPCPQAGTPPTTCARVDLRDAAEDLRLRS